MRKRIIAGCLAAILCGVLLAIFRFSGYQNYDYVLTQQNRHAITDVLNAYNLMCSVSPDVLRKALA